jgi:transmembrane sensor
MMLEEKTREEAASWFAAMRRGPMSLEERDAFDRWRAHPVHQAALSHMHELWGEVSAIKELGVVAPRPGVRVRRLAAAFAAGLVLAGAGVTALVVRPFEARVETDVGEQRIANLSDGSVVGLNVVTKVAYDMKSQDRSVRLKEGEAVFFVKKDATRPFKVRAGDYEIRALGTAFNVQCRDSVVDVAVMEGLVSVVALKGPRAGEEVARIAAGQRLKLPDAGALTTAPPPQPTSAAGVAEWRLRIVSYQDTSVAAVVEDLNRYFERPVVVEDEALASRRITIRLQVQDRDRTLRNLTAMLGAQIETQQRADLLVDPVRS